jgi:hypothetical protein
VTLETPHNKPLKLSAGMSRRRERRGGLPPAAA